MNPRTLLRTINHITVSTLLVCLTACGDDTDADDSHEDEASCSVGSEGCACTKGGSCDDGLTCLSKMCVEQKDDKDDDDEKETDDEQTDPEDKSDDDSDSEAADESDEGPKDTGDVTTDSEEAPEDSDHEKDPGQTDDGEESDDIPNDSEDIVETDSEATVGDSDDIPLDSDDGTDGQETGDTIDSDTIDPGVAAEDNLVSNGDFSAGKEYWELTWQDGDIAASSYEGGEYCIQNGSSDEWLSFSLGYPPTASDAFAIEAGVSYTFSFTVGGYGEFEAKIGQVSEPYDTIYSDDEYIYSSTYETITYTFTPDADEPAAGLVFNGVLEDYGDILCFDDVVLVKTP